MNLAPPSSCQEWSNADVCAWLKSSGLSQKISGILENCARCRLEGKNLSQVDNSYAQNHLQIRDAAKRKVLMDAIAALLLSEGQMIGGNPSGEQTGAMAVSLAAPDPYTTVASSDPRQSSAASSRTTSASSVAPPSLGGGGVGNMGSEPMIGISAQDLMSDGCSHCGWIRKLGAKVHNWKRRYMILKKGCVYYYKDDTAQVAKGQFSLNEYRVERAEVAKFQWCFKFAHMDPRKRTYVVTASSEPELQMWIDKVQNDIDVYCKGVGAAPMGSSIPDNSLLSARCGSPASKSMLSRALDPDDVSSDEVYEKPRSDATPYDKQVAPAPPPPTRRTSVRNTHKIGAEGDGLPAPPARAKTVKSYTHHEPRRDKPDTPPPVGQRQPPTGREANTDSPTVKPRNAAPKRSTVNPAGQQKAPPPLPGEGDPPPLPDEEVPPPLPEENGGYLQPLPVANGPPPLPGENNTVAAPVRKQPTFKQRQQAPIIRGPESRRRSSDSSDGEGSQSEYLQLTDDAAASPRRADGSLPQDESGATYINTLRKTAGSLQRGAPDGSSSKTSNDDYPRPTSGQGLTVNRPTIKPRANKPKAPGAAASASADGGGDSSDDDDDSSEGYIYPDVSEFLPKSAFQDDMDREKSDSFLRNLNKTGCYVIRATSRGTQEAKKVLSVWTGDRCRHYKIFFRKGIGFSLHGDQVFPDVENLLAYYHSNSLPRCPQRLSGPYQGIIKR